MKDKIISNGLSLFHKSLIIEARISSTCMLKGK